MLPKYALGRHHDMGIATLRSLSTPRKASLLHDPSKPVTMGANSLSKMVR